MKTSNANAIRFRLIKRCCVDRGISFAALAKRLQVTPSAITHVAQGNRVSQRIQRALARAAGIPSGELWERA